MTKLLILDGVDNVGKTWLVQQLASSLLLPTCAFPSARLINSELFKNLFREPTQTNKLAWVKELLAEEKTILADLQTKNQTIVVDRMWLSTLVYQGSGVNDDFVFEKEINRLYKNLMTDLGITTYDIMHIVLLAPLTDADPSETNPDKLQFDSKQWTLLEKLLDLLEAFKTGHPNACSDFMGAVTGVNELRLMKHILTRKPPSVDIVSQVQADRLDALQKMLASWVES